MVECDITNIIKTHFLYRNSSNYKNIYTLASYMHDGDVCYLIQRVMIVGSRLDGIMY